MPRYNYYTLLQLDCTCATSQCYWLVTACVSFLPWMPSSRLQVYQNNLQMVNYVCLSTDLLDLEQVSLFCGAYPPMHLIPYLICTEG